MNEGRLFRRKDGKQWSVGARDTDVSRNSSPQKRQEEKSVFAIQHSLIQEEDVRRGQSQRSEESSSGDRTPSSSPSSLDTRHAGPWPPVSR